MNDNLFDTLVHRLQNMEPFTIQKLGPDKVPVDWFTVEPSQLVSLVMLHPANIYADIQQIGVQILEWSRYVSQCQRMWEIHERRLRVYKAAYVVKGKETDPKVAIALLEQGYRSTPEYAELSEAVERASDAYNSVQGVLEALKTKRDMLKTFVRRGRDGNPEILAD